MQWKPVEGFLGGISGNWLRKTAVFCGLGGDGGIRTLDTVTRMTL